MYLSEHNSGSSSHPCTSEDLIDWSACIPPDRTSLISIKCLILYFSTSIHHNMIVAFPILKIIWIIGMLRWSWVLVWNHALWFAGICSGKREKGKRKKWASWSCNTKNLDLDILYFYGAYMMFLLAMYFRWVKICMYSAKLRVLILIHIKEQFFPGYWSRFFLYANFVTENYTFNLNIFCLLGCQL